MAKASSKIIGKSFSARLSFRGACSTPEITARERDYLRDATQNQKARASTETKLIPGVVQASYQGERNGKVWYGCT